VAICLQRGTHLHMAQLMPLPLTVSCFSKIQIGFIFLVPAHPGSPGKGPLNARVCVCIIRKCDVSTCSIMKEISMYIQNYHAIHCTLYLTSSAGKLAGVLQHLWTNSIMPNKVQRFQTVTNNELCSRAASFDYFANPLIDTNNRLQSITQNDIE